MRCLFPKFVAQGLELVCTATSSQLHPRVSWESHSHFWVSFPGGSDGKVFCLQRRRPGFHPWVRKVPWRREWRPPPVFLPGEFQGQRSLASYSPWSCRELDTMEQLTLVISALCINISALWKTGLKVKIH